MDLQDSGAYRRCGIERDRLLSGRLEHVKIALAQINPTVGDFVGERKQDS